MADKSKIEWTHATWNPTTGCNKVSQGCKNCYAEREWKRLSANPASVYYGRSFTNVQCHPERLEQVLNWKKPRMIFVNSMSDLFHQDIPFEFIDEVFATMAVCEQHTFQVLTKRPDRMLEWSKVAFQTLPTVRCLELSLEEGTVTATGYDDADHRWQWPLKNVWLGVSVENQEAANERIPLLLQTPAAIRWISAEPLLGSLNLPLAWCLNCNKLAWIYKVNNDKDWGCLNCGCNVTGLRTGFLKEAPVKLDWVVTGGESGPNARPSDPEHFRSLRDQCRIAGIPFFFKQWGEFKRVTPYSIDNEWMDDDYQIHQVKNEMARISGVGQNFYLRAGKKNAGRTLDGRTWDELPVIKEAA